MRGRPLITVDFPEINYHFDNSHLAFIGFFLIPFFLRLFLLDYNDIWHSVSQPRLVALGSSYLLTALLGYFALAKRVRGWKIAFSLLGILVLNQILIKTVYRYLIPGFSERAGDELVWLAEMRKYQVAGSIPMSRTVEGPGIFLLVSLISPIFAGDYSQTSIAIGLLLGSIYVLPLFAMQYRATNSRSLALFATAISAQFDVIAYSTTIARPTLIGLFLLPMLIYLFMEYRARGEARFLLAFIPISLALLIIHPSFTYVVLLIILFATWLIFGFKARFEKITSVLLFGIYGFTLKLAVPELYGIWRIELLTQTPLRELNPELFLLIFFAPPLFLLLFDAFRKRLAPYLRVKSFFVSLAAQRLILISIAFFAFASVFSFLVYRKYVDYISIIYGGFPSFLTLHGWKIPMAILALYGLVKVISAKPMSDTVCITFAWLFSITLIVVFFLVYTPYQHHLNLYNLDERFFEFGIFPAAAFIAFAVDDLLRRMRSPTNRLLLIASFSAYVIPSIIVGMRDPVFFWGVFKPP